MKIIKIYEVCGMEVLSRSNIRKIRQEITGEISALDFSEVSFMSRSAADELLSIMEESSFPVHRFGETEAVKTMIEIVAAGRKQARRPVSVGGEIVDCADLKDFSRLLLGI
ncbi:MAG: hypothetical protein HFJ87_01670 [Muribaculaceae bacterium]|nr:hypothetical protein [Muribaculaceae bacterium]